MGDKVLVYRPTGAARTSANAAEGPAPMIQSLAGLQVALVDNGKPNALNLLLGLADALEIPSEHRIIVPGKDYPSRPLNPFERGLIEGRADVAVMALGD